MMTEGRGRESGLDLGLTHVALDVSDAATSIEFYRRYAGMQVVHQRAHDGKVVAWLSDLTRPFAVVLIESEHAAHPLAGSQHLGVACESSDEVDQRCRQARDDGCAVRGPEAAGPPVGYWAIITDPDGHNLELSFGQHVSVTVDEHSG